MLVNVSYSTGCIHHSHLPILLIVLIPEAVSMTNTHELIKQDLSEQLSRSSSSGGLSNTTGPDVTSEEKNEISQLGMKCISWHLLADIISVYIT